MKSSLEMPKIKQPIKALKALEKITGGKLTLSRLILAIRQCDEMTQTEFAKKLNISKRQLCEIECGRKPVSLKSAILYARKLGYSVDQFVRLCLQDMVDRAKLNIIIETTLNSSKNSDIEWSLAA